MFKVKKPLPEGQLPGGVKETPDWEDYSSSPDDVANEKSSSACSARKS